MQNNCPATNSTGVPLALPETSDPPLPDGWKRISCGTLVYYRNEVLHVTTDDATMMGITDSTEFNGFLPPANVDIHFFWRHEWQGRQGRRDYAIFVYHDERVACEPRPWPALLPGADIHVLPSRGAPGAVGYHFSSLPYNPLSNGSEAPSSNVRPLSPPVNARITSPHVFEEPPLDKRIRYWDYVRQHPGHVDVGSFGRTVREHLLWSRNERALSLGTDPAFSHEECEMFLRYLDTTPPSPDSMQANARHTRLIAALMRRILKCEYLRQWYERQQMYGATSADAMTRRKSAWTWPRWILYFILIQVILLGQPNTYARRLSRFRRGVPLSLDIHTKHWQAFIGGFVKEWNDTNLIIATVMISATVSFLAVPGLDSISRILGIIAIITAVGSGLLGMVYVWHHAPRANTDALVGRTYIQTGKSVFGIQSTLLFACVLAFPVVLLWWSFLTFIAAVLVYGYRGQFLDPVTNTTQDFSTATKYVALVSFVLVLACSAVGCVFMSRTWRPINDSEHWGSRRSNDAAV